MTPRRRPKAPGWVARAFNGMDANKLIALAIALLATFGYSDNRSRTDKAAAQVTQQVTRARGRLTARVDSLLVAFVDENAQLRSELRSLRRELRRRPAAAAAVATNREDPEEAVESEEQPQPKRNIAQRLWAWGTSPFRAFKR